MNTTHETVSLDTLPSEILIEVLSRVEYRPSLDKDLRLVNRRFKQVTESYERCIAGNILKTDFRWAFRQFPGLILNSKRKGNGFTWHDLKSVFRRTAILANIKGRCKVIRETESETSAWTTCRALAFHQAGLLLLYRIYDSGSHDGKACLLRGLPKESLAILFFTMVVSIHLLRAIGPQMTLYSTTSDLTNEARADIELAFEEVLLRQGPEFLLGLLMHDKECINTLKNEVAAMDARQTHFDNGAPPPTTLIATMRQTFAARVGCEIRYNLVHMWYVLDEECYPLADSDEETARTAMERVVNGEELGRRCERCKMLRMAAGF